MRKNVYLLIMAACIYSLLLLSAGCSQNSKPSDKTTRFMNLAVDFQNAYKSTLLGYESYVQNAFVAASCSIRFYFRGGAQDTLPTDSVDVRNSQEELRQWGMRRYYIKDTTKYLHLFFIKNVKNGDIAFPNYTGATIVAPNCVGKPSHIYGGGPRSCSFVFMEPIVKALEPCHLENQAATIYRQVTIHELGHQWANLDHDTSKSNDCVMIQGIWVQEYNDPSGNLKYRFGGDKWTKYFHEGCKQLILKDSLRFDTVSATPKWE